MSLKTITQIIDMMMVGPVWPFAITAIGLSFSPLFLALSLFFAISIATTALVARHKGAKEEEMAGHFLYQSILLSLVGVIIVSFFFYQQAPSIIALMGATDEVIPLGIEICNGSPQVLSSSP